MKCSKCHKKLEEDNMVERYSRVELYQCPDCRKLKAVAVRIVKDTVRKQQPHDDIEFNWDS